MATFNRFLMGLLLGTALMISACSVAQQPVAPSFLTEARAIRAKNPNANKLDLTHIVQNYIRLSMQKEAALYVRDLGFEIIRDVNPVPDRSEQYVARKRERSPPGWSAYSHDEYGVVRNFLDEKLTRVEGWLFLQSL